MPKIREVYFEALEKGKNHGVLSQDIRTMIAHDMGYAEPIDTLFHQNDEFTAKSQFDKQFAQLLDGKPVEYILHECKFLDHKLYVDENVLIPRMETQELIAHISEKVDDYYDPRNYLVCADIGTGSGCIAIALKSLFPNWLITATDVSEAALSVAKKNLETYHLPIHTELGSGLEPFIRANMALDILVSNPPYIINKEEVQPSVARFEPEGALYMDPAHSVYEAIFKDYKKVKKNTLLMCFEIGYDLEDFLKDLMSRYLENYDYEFLEDLNGLKRFLFICCH